MPDNQIFKATYSGIPVYEMMCKGVAVMRRRADSWLNATQILKVAGFDKPQRTRILEREVQKGEHEKVQGGYGKYQAIIDFQPEAKSPPLAPKHLVAAQTAKPSARRANVEAAASSSVMHTRSSRKTTQQEVVDGSDVETLSVRGSEDGSMTPSPSEASSSSRTPSPIRSSPEPSASASNGIDEDMRSPSPEVGRKRKQRPTDETANESDIEAAVSGPPDHTSTYGDMILEYFISDTNQIPSILISPPSDFDPNMAIDDDGHTALHWASAMGRIRIVKLLLTAGADIFKVNKAGQTPLMRSVMFANNYDVRKFPELYELLHRSTLNIDNSNRTVFHHIVDVAMSKGKTHAARYYMETVLQRLADYPRELADIINFQDEDGETALTMAARCRSKRLVKILLDHGADPKIANRDGKSTEDYILEDERFRSSPVLPSRQLSMSFRNSQAAFPPSGAPPYYSFGSANGDRPTIHYSVTGQKAATRCVNDATMMLENLAASFDQELKDKERDLNQANALLGNIQAEILESQRAVTHLKIQAQGLPQTKQNLQVLEEELHTKMGKRYRMGWEKWVKDEEEREKAIRDAAGGQLISSTGEPVSDLLALYGDVASDPDSIREECEKLREELQVHKKRRVEAFDELVKFQAEAGTGGRMAEYRRLIGAGCGGVPPGEVDSVLGMLLETLESEEPSSSIAWSGTVPAPRPSGTTPWTKHFRHLLPAPRWLVQRRNRVQGDPVVKVVKPKDRIKYWNIVPGDQVGLLGDSTRAIHEVHKVNKLTNRVYLKKEVDKTSTQRRQPVGRNVPYSRCRLFVGKFEFPPAADSTEPRILPVFASRLSISKAVWNRIVGRWHWNRFAVNTVPRLPNYSKETTTPYDTLAEAVTEVTYTPPMLPASTKVPVPSPPSAQSYVNSLRKPEKHPYDASQPIEVHLQLELSNPHSRAKQQARWKAYQEYKVALLKEYIVAELKNLQGRTRRVATAEATFKWRQRLIDDRKAEMKRRAKNRGEEARLLRKKERNARKLEKQRERLRNLVLEEAPNQVIPRATV
ncbi:Cell division cycle-related protein res2/pct1 [Grifola frondosa]|uniref:Cell division cycle-related protein res2/pct1 n=1 Tax=Grifola frondosa TaxID=5627 RepID=A0A1C7M4T5_GRIFR|nr:Cell division cycle-related protein res2/pct1 [Grifola frondosa]